jgi:putative transposase
MNVNVLEEAYKQERNPKVKERILMVIGVLDDKTTRQVAADLHRPQPNVVYWKRRFEEEGLDGLKDRPRSGRSPKVASWKLERVKTLIEKKQCWMATEVMKLIYEKTGVRYSLMHITRLLHSWGLSKQRPMRKHVNAASDEEVERFKKVREKR